ncbi:MAG: putative sugar O-methyltransferase [Anaerolineae bacterium]|nr:putative sugar O-methyltransferase [Anaerolineae bacterium]
MNENLLLYQKYQEIKPFFERLIEENDLAEDFSSDFWKKLLNSRHNFPSYNEILAFRREGMASYIGFKPNVNEINEHVSFISNYHRATAIAPLSYLQSNQESSIGLPYQYYREGILSSGAGLYNATIAYRIEQALLEYQQARPACHTILEIGAGYGGVAEILIQNLQPDAYIICDLPQNLFLGAFYLSVNHPDFSLIFVNNEPPQEIPRRSLVFATPKGLEVIDRRFSLVINTISFQEMTLSEVNRYFKYIQNHLADNGLFYFFNHHGAAGPQKPGDYPIEMFDVKKWGPLPVPFPEFFHRKQHYEIVMTPKHDDAKFYPAFDPITQLLSMLIFMGVDKNILSFCDRLIRSDICDRELNFLMKLFETLNATTPQSALDMIAKLTTESEWQPIVYYISGILNMLVKNDLQAKIDFENALQSGLEGYAKVKALVGLGILADEQNGQERAELFFKQAIEILPQFAPDLEKGAKTVKFDRFIKTFHFAFPNLGIDTIISRPEYPSDTLSFIGKLKRKVKFGLRKILLPLLSE